MEKIKLTTMCLLIIVLCACSSAATDATLQTTGTPNENDDKGGALEPAPEELLDEQAADESNTALSAEAENMVAQSISRIAEFESDSIPMQDVEVVSAEQMLWPDSSLGCPMDGMMYTQAIVSGYLIELEANGNSYELHTDTGNKVILCTVNNEKLAR